MTITIQVPDAPDVNENRQEEFADRVIRLASDYFGKPAEGRVTVGFVPQDAEAESAETIQAIGRGLANIEAGHTVSIDEAIENTRARLAARFGNFETAGRE